MGESRYSFKYSVYYHSKIKVRRVTYGLASKGPSLSYQRSGVARYEN